jgi:hypothetical protein
VLSAPFLRALVHGGLGGLVAGYVQVLSCLLLRVLVGYGWWGGWLSRLVGRWVLAALR